MMDAPKFPPFASYSWDERKREANLAKSEGRPDFTAAEDFDWSTAFIFRDNRFDYGEVREVAIGYVGRRLHVMVFTRRAPCVHIISLRKANDREGKLYDAQKT
jgi:uncharacterized protein